MSTLNSQSIYFVDASLTDLDALLAGLPAGAEIVLIQPDRDGLQQMLDALAGRSDIDALHVLTHGGPGKIQLGGTTLDINTLDAASAALRQVADSLANEADILFYGCDVAASDEGLALIGRIADLTGADVAASTDLTGSARLGGDWVLENATGAIEAHGLEANHFSGTLAAPTITGFGPAGYTENAGAAAIDSTISLTSDSYGGGYLRFNITSANAADQLALSSAGNANTNGAISRDGNTVYLGNGSGKEAIGSIDSIENGVNGKALKINFTSNFTNPSFETGSATGWTIGTSQVKLGSTVINGKTSPSDPTFATKSGGDGDTPQSFSYNSQVATGGAAAGSYSLRLYSNGTTANGYDVVHGPYAFSNTFQASAGDKLYFDWKAQGGSDAFDAFGYLMNADTGVSRIVLDRTGANASATTPWATASVDVPTSGNWFFVFVAGTWDATGGRAAGGSLYIDNVKVFGNKVNTTVAQNILSQVTYQNTAEDAPASRNLALTIADGNGVTTTANTTLTVTNTNDAPTLTANAVLLGVLEDATNPVGATVQSLFGNKFADVDNTYSPTDSLAGIVVVADASTAGQGKWQYTTAGTPSSADWQDIGSVSTAAGLVLSATTKVRFLPGTDYPAIHGNATPGGLTVHGVDSSYAGSYATGTSGSATRATFDTTTDDGTSAVSAAGVALSTTVTEVNDAPRFNGAAANPLTFTYTETAGVDVSGAGALTLTGGTLAASDVESDTFSFGIRGGVLSSGVESKVGLYGTLSVDASTGVWSYTPNATVINALKAGAVATDSFEFKVTDAAGAMSVQTFTATLNGTNDTPLVATALVDQSLTGNAPWSYQLPANAFTDAEGTGLTYSVKLVTAEGDITLLDPDGGGTKAAGDLPGNLTFDTVTRTFSGNPGANGDFFIQVTATDDGAATASDVFKLNASGVNEAPIYNGGLGPKVLPFGGGAWSIQIPDTVFTDPESDTLTWSAWVGVTALNPGTSALAFDPVTRTLSGDGTTFGVVEIRVTDTAANTTAAQFSVAIATTATDSVTLKAGSDPIPDTTWTGAGSHSFTLPADTFVLDGDTATVFSAKLSNNDTLPAWLTFNTVSGTFSGNPPTGATGPLDITVTATKGTASANDTFKLTLNDTNDAPVLQSMGAANQLSTNDGTWSYNFGELFKDPDGSANGTTATTTGITYTLAQADGTAAPAWISVDSASRTLSGNPPGGQTFLNLKLVATDAGGATAFTTFTLNLQGTAVYGVNNPGGVTITDVNGGTLLQGDVLQAATSDTESIVGSVVYQWQSSSDGSTWADIANASNVNFTLSQAQVGQQVRVQAFYNDGGGVAESPVATALGPVINVNDPANLSITGSLDIGATVSATLSDADGLTGATVGYKWQRSSDNSTWGDITDATYRTYTVTDADGGKYVRVMASYTDDQNTLETPKTAGTLVQVGAKAPVARPDVAALTEAGGTANGTGSTSPATGNLITDAPRDTDDNGNGTITGVTEVRTGSLEGEGTAATDTDITWTLVGIHGTLVVIKATGYYIYTLDQDDFAVQELNAGSSVTDTFNYTISDSTARTGNSTLTITINGANDYPTISGTLPASVTAIEDVASNVDLSAIRINDVDSTNVTIKLVASEGTLAATTADGVTVGTSGTAILTLTGSKTAVSDFLQTASNVQYTSAAHDNGTPGATVAVTYQDNAMGATWLSLGTVNVNITSVNDAPAGTDKTITFLEDATYTFTPADFGFADVADTVTGGSSANTLLAVKISTLPADGILKLDGVAVAAGDFVQASDITANKLTFEPATTANNKSTTGADYTSLTFQVQDNGGTNGADATASTPDDGVDLDPTPNTITLNVTPVNDAPVLQNAGTSAPTLVTITEDEIGNTGNLISTLVRAVDGTDPTDTTQSVVTDVDYATQGSTGGSPNERWDGGVAIYGLTNTGPADGGKWQFKLGTGSWADVGTVAEGSALLLASTDSIRFLPDTLNGTTATFSYYIWDGSSGSAGNTADVATANRGGSTAFSVAGDTASITVTHLNDAPTLDLDGNNSSTATGTSFTTTFRPRGEAVAVVDADITISDVDKLATGPDYITGATVALTAGASDNLFGSTFETLSFKNGGATGTAATTYAGSAGAITITGNATTSLTLSGKGTWADYQSALKGVYYSNANPNAATGDRSVTVTVTDGALTVGEAAGDRLASTSAQATVTTPWTTVVDLNGAGAGRDNTATYTEDTAGVAVATSTASLDNQAVNIKTVALALSPTPDGVAEKLFVSAALVTFLGSRGITVQTNETHTVTLVATNTLGGYSGTTHGAANSGVSAENMQLALRAVQYVNTSQNPSVGNREVNVSVVDTGNNGVGAKTIINIVPVNDAPVKGGDYAAGLNEGAVYVFANADLNSTDVDNAAGTLKYVLTSTPAQGTLFRDTNNNGVVDTGEAIATVGDSTSVAAINAIGTGGYFTQAEVNAGTIKYAHNGQNPNGTNATGNDTLGFKVVDGMEDYAFANIATNQTGTVTLTITEVDDLPTGAPVVSGTLQPGQVLTANVTSIADADADGLGAFGYQWQVSSDNGVNWTNATGTGSTTASYTLVTADSGQKVRVQVSHTDAFGHTATSLDSNATGTVSFDNTGSAGGVTITDDGSPQAGETLTANTSAVTDTDGLGPFSYQWETSTDNGANWTTVTGATGKTFTLPTDAATDAQFRAAVSYTDGRGNAESITSSAATMVAPTALPNQAPSLTGDGAFPATPKLFSGVAVSTVESGQTIQTLTLTVSGLKDGTAEKLTVDGVVVDLVATASGALTYPTPAPVGSVGGVSYAITVASGVATVTVTHAGLTEAQTKTLVQGLAFANEATTPTAGLRVVTLTSLKDSGGIAVVNSMTGDDTGLIGLSATVDVGNSLANTPSSNTAPTVSGDLAATVAEGGVVALTTTDLAGTDAEHGGSLKVVLFSAPTHGTLFRDANGNGLVDAGEKLTTDGQFALADVANGRIKYLHDGGETTTGSFTFRLSDGYSMSDESTAPGNHDPHTFNFTITPVDDMPTLTATTVGTSSAPVAFLQGGAATDLFQSPDASAGETGENITGVTLSIGGLRNGAGEKLVVDGVEVALTNSTTGTTATSSVGYSVSVTGGTATVTLTKDATGAVWNGLLDGLAYKNSSTNPTDGTRSITLTSVTETGDQKSNVALTSYVSVTAVNAAPSLTLTDFTVAEGASKTLTTTDIAATDPDTALTSLTYTLSTAPTHGTVYIDANGNGKLDTVEALASAGTFTHSQLASGKVRYQHDDGESGDSFAVTASDGFATSSAATMTVTRTPVNDAPSIAGLGSDVLSYAANSGAKTLEQGANAVVTDPDSGNFSGGTLRVSISFNRDPAHDVLSIQNVGAAAGQIGVSGGNVTFAGATIGTLAGGTGTSDLVVTFNTDATPAAVSALVNAIQFANGQAAPANTSRTVSFALNDGQTGGQAAPVAVNVNIATGVTPTISIANGFFIIENTQLVTALSATDPNGRPITFSVSGTADATNNPDGAKFEIVSGNLLRFKAGPDFEARADAGADNVYNVIVRATNDQGSFVEQALAVTVLNQDPEGVAVGDTEGPAFGFATVNGSTLVMTYTDASPLSASNLPAPGAFTVSGNTVTAVAVNATAKTVTLTLGTAVTNGQTVTVAYTDPTAGNDVLALQDAAGNDAPSLGATSVTNVTPSAGGGGTTGGGGGGGTTTPTLPTTPPEGTVTGGTTTTTTGSGGTTTTTTGTLGTVTVVETVTVTTAGETVRELVYVPVGSGAGAGGTVPVTLPLLYEAIAGSDSNTTITLPSGVGLVSVGERTPALSGHELDLITLIRQTVSEGDPSRGGMLGGGQSFLDGRSDGSTLWVNKIVLTTPTPLPSAPATPIVVDGAANNASSNYTGDKLEALVIDASALPPGTVIELQNVDFAVILGEGVIVRGGNGANVVFGGDGAQNILLGPDDDVLYGGAGDDIVGSEGGADQLFGNAGNDTLFGGAGADILHGGADTDVVTFTGSISRYEIVRDHGKTIVRSLDRLDDIDTLINVETIRFDDATYAVQNAPQYTWIASLYGEVLHRQAELAGFQYWAERYASGESIGEIALNFLYSVEYQSATDLQFAQLSTAPQLDLLYQHFLGREPDAAGHAYWMEKVSDGMSIDQVAQLFVGSEEMQGVYMHPTAWEFLL